MNHDVLQLVDSTSGASEYVQVSGDPTRLPDSHRDPRRRRHHGDDLGRERLDRQPDRQQPDRRRGQSDRSDDRWCKPNSILPNLSISRPDRRVGPDGPVAGHAGRDSDPVRLQHDRAASEHGRRHRDLRLLWHRPGADRRVRRHRQNERSQARSSRPTSRTARPTPVRTDRPT